MIPAATPSPNSQPPQRLEAAHRAWRRIAPPKRDQPDEQEQIDGHELTSGQAPAHALISQWARICRRSTTLMS